MPLVLTPDPGRPKTPAGSHDNDTLAEPVFAGLLKDWHTLSCAPGGMSVNAASLSDVLGQIRGAAVRDRCPNGTGWPSRASA
jgi:hypothetical protein